MYVWNKDTKFKLKLGLFSYKNNDDGKIDDRGIY